MPMCFQVETFPFRYLELADYRLGGSSWKVPLPLLLCSCCRAFADALLPIQTAVRPPLSRLSLQVLRHGLQCVHSARFQAWDYGQQGNLEQYGSATPLDYLSQVLSRVEGGRKEGGGEQGGQRTEVVYQPRFEESAHAGQQDICMLFVCKRVV